MCEGKSTEATKNSIKALYETINMYYPSHINERLLTFLREKNLVYENREFQAFIKVPPVNDLQNEAVSSYNKRYRKERARRIIYTVGMFVFLLAAFITFARMAKSTSGSDSVFFIVLAVIFYLLAFAFSFFIMNGFDQSRRARIFYKEFAPWLEQILAEKKMDQEAQQQKIRSVKTVSENPHPFVLRYARHLSRNRRREPRQLGISSTVSVD